MKILEICAAYKPAYIYGGPTMSVSKLAEQLTKAGISTEVYTTTANGKTELLILTPGPLKVDGVTVCYFKRLTKDHTHFSPSLLRQLWKQAKTFDVIHIHTWWNLVSVFSCMVALIRNVPVLISPRGTLSAYSFINKNASQKWFIHHLIGKHLLKHCHLHTTSTFEADAVGKLVKAKAVATLPNFVEFPFSPAGGHKDMGFFKLIFLSRIEEKKGLDILINALPFINVPYKLTIAGDGDTTYVTQLKELAEEKNIAANIDWVGFKGKDKFDLLAEHDLLVLPSHDENFGNVVIESLSEGTAVLISPFVGLADYVTENQLGWQCELNAGEWGFSINSIANKKKELSQIRSGAPAIIKNDFAEDILVKKYIDLYRNISNRQ